MRYTLSNDEFDKFDAGVRKILSVSREELKRREEQWRQENPKRERKPKTSASLLESRKLVCGKLANKLARNQLEA